MNRDVLAERVTNSLARRVVNAEAIRDDLVRLKPHIEGAFHCGRDPASYTEPNILKAADCFRTRHVPCHDEQVLQICMDATQHLRLGEAIAFMQLPLGAKMFALFEGDENVPWTSEGLSVLTECVIEASHGTIAVEEAQSMFDVGFELLKQHDGDDPWLPCLILLHLVVPSIVCEVTNWRQLVDWDCGPFALSILDHGAGRSIEDTRVRRDSLELLFGESIAMDVAARLDALGFLSHSGDSNQEP
jgi:hypothetical protein